MNMKGTNRQPFFNKLLGAPTPAKASGLAYSLAVLLPSVVAFIAVAIFFACGWMQEGYDKQDWFIYFNFVLPQLCFALTAFFALRYANVSLGSTMQKQKCTFRYFGIAVLLQIGLFSFSELNTLFLEFLEGFGYTPEEIRLPSTNGWGFIGSLIAVAVLPAVFEEILFRGVLLGGMKQFGEVKAALLCGALFALYHQNPPQTVYQFICGTAFAFIAMRSGSILPTVLSHFLNNAFILCLYAFNVQTFPTPIYVVYIVVSVLCLLAAVWLLWRDKTMQDNTPKQKAEKAEVKNFFRFAAVGIAVCALTWLLVLLTGM